MELTRKYIPTKVNMNEFRIYDEAYNQVFTNKNGQQEQRITVQDGLRLTIDLRGQRDIELNILMDEGTHCDTEPLESRVYQGFGNTYTTDPYATRVCSGYKLTLRK